MIKTWAIYWLVSGWNSSFILPTDTECDNWVVFCSMIIHVQTASCVVLPLSSYSSVLCFFWILQSFIWKSFFSHSRKSFQPGWVWRFSHEFYVFWAYIDAKVSVSGRANKLTSQSEPAPTSTSCRMDEGIWGQKKTFLLHSCFIANHGG